jgi:predicted signal transduction protein with EAL and GGDEF domain
MEVVAEGIETVGQLDQLRALNCEQGQGYYFSTPVDSEMATELIQNDERGECLGYVGSRDDREAPSAVIALAPSLPDAPM